MSKWEKWLHRIAIIAVAIYEVVKTIIESWS
jgi:hypothetical protein